jgi:hypothetical protein
MSHDAQLTAHILMIRPVRFGYNAETAVNNAFQHASGGDTQAAAIKEFDAFVEKLRAQDIEVTVINDSPEPHTPDSIFPNNWVSFHADGTACLYPMFAENRRLERKALDAIKQQWNIRQIIDFTHYEPQGKFLEGTGSMILDRTHRITYACLSPRTQEEVLADFCRKMNYTPVTFTATDAAGQAIYHTNVMMCVAETYAIVCLECIANEKERTALQQQLTKTGKEIIAITREQMNHFAGNMLQVKNRQGQRFLVLSATACRALTPDQTAALRKYNELITPDIHIIEVNGGGSARCMMAEVFLPER